MSANYQLPSVAINITLAEHVVMVIMLPDKQWFDLIPWRQTCRHGRCVKRRRVSGVVIEFTW